MASAGSNPTVRRWELAARLRQLRLDAGRSIEEAAAELLCSPAKISRMETGGRGVQPRDVRDLCRFYGVPDSIKDDLMRAATEARRPAWWQRFRTFEDVATTYHGLEDAAQEVRIFQNLLVPGLFQTERFAVELLSRLRPEGELTPEWISERVSARLHRQKRVFESGGESGGLVVDAIIDEAALRREVGGQDIMCEQLDRLIEHSRHPNVTIRVIPFGHGPHPGLEGAFQHLTFPDGSIDDVVFVEGLLGLFILDKAHDVDHYRLVFEDLGKRFALDPEESRRWLADLRDGAQVAK